MPQPARRVVHAGPVQIATESFGDAANPAIVLVMGATASMLGWPVVLCERLAAEGFFVLRYDHRDTGQSTTFGPGAADYVVEDLAEDLLEVLAAYGVRQAHVVGMSLGGYIGQWLAVNRSGAVATLTLISSEPLGWDGPPLPHIAPSFLSHFESLGSLDWRNPAQVEAFLLEIMALSTGSRYGFQRRTAQQAVREVMRYSRDIASSFNHGRVTLGTEEKGAFRNVACPVLVIHGTEEPILPYANAEALTHWNRAARLITMDGVGHELPRPLVPPIAALIAAFCASPEAVQSQHI
jgi:pimeloyl-ACP methyl ester carboxylesterase